MPKFRHAKFALAAALLGGMAALLVCLLCWNQGWNPAWAGAVNLQAGAVIGDAEVSEPPVVSSAAAEESAVPPVAAPDRDTEPQANQDPYKNPGQEPGKAAKTEETAAPSPADQQAAPQSERQADRQGVPDSSAPLREDAKSAGDASAPVSPQSPDKPAPSTTGNPSAPGAASSAAHDAKVHLFGTVEFKRPLSTLPGWLDLLKRNHLSPIFIPGKVFKKGVTWESFKAKAPVNKKMELLRYVNSFWNTWPYVEDIVNWGQEDYWEIPAEFLKKSGDCEDYSIIKYFTLKELGIPPESMRIVVVRDTIRNFAHAVLVVYLNNDAFVLDNLSNSVLSHTKVRQYRPQYSVNEFGRWAHMKGRKIE